MWWTMPIIFQEEQKQTKNRENEKSKNLALSGLAVQVEYLSNLYS